MENYNNDRDQNSNEDFGLPEHAFQPIERKETEMGNVNKPTNKPIENKPSYNWPVIVALLVILGLSGFIIYYFVVMDGPKEPETVSDFATTEQTTDQAGTDYTYNEDSAWEETTTTAVEEEEPVEEVSEPVVEEPKIGSISQVTGRTGLSYVVIGSFFDGDLANDRAEELKAEGFEVFVLHPTDKKKFFRVAVSSFNTYAEGEVAAESLKNTFGEEVWVLRY